MKKVNAGWKKARNILCVRLDTLGDVLMTTPAIRALKETLGSQITLLTSSRGAPAAALVPEIDDIITYDAPWLKATPMRPNSEMEVKMINRLRKRNFDAVVIFTVFSQNPLPSALLSYLANIPLRLAYSRENPYQLLTHWVPDPDTANDARHEVQRQLDLVAAVGCETSDTRLSAAVPLEMIDCMQELLEQKGVDFTNPWVVIHPGASAPSRRYMPEGYAEVARLLAREGIQIVFSGDPSERKLVQSIQDKLAFPSFSVAGEISLPNFAAVLKLAPLLISNNTGPVHLAAAVGTPIVDVYALTNPQHTPWGVPNRVLSHDVPCRNCFKSTCPLEHNNCLRLIKPKAIAKAARELLLETQTVAALDPLSLLELTD